MSPNELVKADDDYDNKVADTRLLVTNKEYLRSTVAHILSNVILTNCRPSIKGTRVMAE